MRYDLEPGIRAWSSFYHAMDPRGVESDEQFPCTSSGCGSGLELTDDKAFIGTLSGNCQLLYPFLSTSQPGIPGPGIVIQSDVIYSLDGLCM
jgi:hypothetical protein